MTNSVHKNTDVAANMLDVSLQQRSTPALDVKMRCNAGELLALVGPSGSGKTTVLRSIAGLQAIDTGFVKCASTTWLDTKNNVNVTIQLRRVGMVFQHYALFPHKTALENVALAIRDKSTKEKRLLAASWLERTNMTGMENRLPRELSGGQRQRVALARALAGNPSVLLLDEPFSAVDQQTRRKLYRELAKLRSGLEIPMILVTHDVLEVQQLADSLCLIHKGQTLQQGTVHDVITKPNNKNIAKLLGHQNLFTATVASLHPTLCVFKLSDTGHLNGPVVNLTKGASVTLLIAPSAISLAISNEICSKQPNLLRGTVRDAVSMGDEWSITVHLDAITKSLRFRVPAHTVSPEQMKPGYPISVNVRPSGIYVIDDSFNTVID
ncbi:MAG: molybdate transport system ATP-binding protein [Porticoccaceae bacterium]|jgi:molybdate transport system ATP-binding protein